MKIKTVNVNRIDGLDTIVRRHLDSLNCNIEELRFALKNTGLAVCISRQESMYGIKWIRVDIRSTDNRIIRTDTSFSIQQLMILLRDIMARTFSLAKYVDYDWDSMLSRY